MTESDATYFVETSEVAAREIAEICSYIATSSPQNAAAVEEQILTGIMSLQRMPSRCPFALEPSPRGFELRHLISKPFRIIFTVQDNVVLVLGVRHAKRHPDPRFPKHP